MYFTKLEKGITIILMTKIYFFAFMECSRNDVANIEKGKTVDMQDIPENLYKNVEVMLVN